MEETYCYQFTIRSTEYSNTWKRIEFKALCFSDHSFNLKKKKKIPVLKMWINLNIIKLRRKKKRSKQACIYLYLKANPSVLLHFIEFINSCFHIYHSVPGNTFYFLKPQLSWNLDVKRKWVSFLFLSFF